MEQKKSLRGQPPAAVVDRLCAELGTADFAVCTSTDIDRFGNYADQWLAATHKRLAVSSNGQAPKILLSLDLAEAKEFRTQSGVGSGVLLAKVDGTYIDLVRYSNREAYRFERLARKLDQSVRGEPLEVTEEDERDPRRCAKCDLLLDQPGETCSLCVDRGAVLARMVRLMRPYAKAAAAMMSLLVVGIALDLVSPQLTRYLVDNVLPGGAEEAARLRADDAAYRQALNALASVVAILAGVQILRMIVNILNGRLASGVGTAITHDMRSRLVSHLQQLSIGFYDRQQVGSLVGRVAYDTESLHGFVWQLTGGFLLQLLMVIGVGIMMFSIDTRLALFALLPAPLVMGGTIFFWKRIYPRYHRAWDASSKQAGALSGMLSGVRVVKAFSQETRELERFNQTSARLRASRNSVDMAIGTFNPVIGLIFQLGGWIVWYVGGRDVLNDQLTLGDLMAFFGYLWMFYGPLAALPQFTNWLTQFATQANRIFEILDTPAAISQPERPVAIPHMRGEVEFQRVTFGYHRHTPVLKNVDLRVEPGEFVGVVGSSGSGKSTIVNLICRFYDVDEGRVLVDGVDVRDISKDELRRQIGVVLQEPFLFRGSIIENIAYGKPAASPEAVLAASKAGNCHDFIMRQPHAYDTWVGERGAGLSGGERQRIGIARVLLTDPRILILDEATSSVDPESEAAIQAALKELVKGRTTIAIAHRLSTLRWADRILVVDNGRIAESGSHEQLLAAKGIYERLVRLQSQVPGASVEQLEAVARERALEKSLAEAEPAPGPEELPPVGGHRLRWLRPDIARIHLGTYETMHVSVLNERSYGGVYALRCMPVQHPRAYISLRYMNADGHEQEVGMIRSLDEWPTEARELVEQSLRKRYFVHTIRSIDAIEQINNYLSFIADTDLGQARFTVRAQSDRVQDYGRAGKMLLDTDENRYLIPDVEALSPAEQRLFHRYVYW